MWLEGWNNRIELTFDGTKIDEDLVDFPVMINLSSGTGQTEVDITDVFTTLSGNNKKIAMADQNANQSYIEIENWDWYNKKAILWTNVTLASGVNSKYYLYYDSTHADNTTYVGEVLSAPAKNVWDNNFVAIYHMAQDPSGGSGAIKDSTVYLNHGTSTGNMTTSDLVDGNYGKALDFDGSDDWITCGSNNSLDLTGSFTIESIVAPKTISASRIISKGGTTSSYKRNYYLYTSTNVTFSTETTDDVYKALDSNNTIVADGTYYYLVGTHTGTTNSIYFNGFYDNSRTDITSVATNTAPMYIGQVYEDPGDPVNSKISEIRLSNILRSDAWIKASYYSNWDDLISYSTPDTSGAPSHYYDGYVYQFGSPVSRYVRLYRRDSGELIDQSLSNETTGYYYLTTTLSGEHYIVCLDADELPEFNDLIISSDAPQLVV